MNEDDEIQILGENRKKKNASKHTKILYAVLILAVLTGATLFLTTDKEKCEDRLTENLREKQNVPDIEPKRSYSTSRMDIVCDTIYDVPLKIFKLTDMAAELMIGLPDTNDTKIVMALGAADIRKDKNNILGDFFIDGEQYSFGKRKEGCVIIRDGDVWLGASATDTVCRYCIKHKASMFRQYPLVINSEVYPNKLKGKSVRRALADRENDNSIYIVVSRGRESMHDFSEALADLGFSNAIYLPGGDSFSFYRSNEALEYLGTSKEYICPNSNFIVFRKRTTNRE